MQDKSTTNAGNRQELTICKDQSENTIEFFGLRKNMTVMFFQKEKVKKWEELPKELFILMANAYQQDAGAKDYFATWSLPYCRQVELYTYFNYGSLDPKPDILDGILQPCENFRHSEDCPSKVFDSKKWTLNRQELNERDLVIIDMIAKDFQDWQIAAHLGIAVSSYNAYKGKLFKKTNTQSRVGLLMASFRERLISY